MDPGLDTFYKSVREERLFCAVLYHLLLQSTDNVREFVAAINEQLSVQDRVEVSGDSASIYVEFTYLRDTWYALGRKNEDKRAFVLDLFSSSPLLSSLTAETLPLSTECAEFNARFMGDRGLRIQSDIAYPGQWPVKALRQNFGANPEHFRELCRVKWAFNIKPDLVIIRPGSKPICVEAKLESREGTYPTSNEECAIFDSLFGISKRRVKQVELQQFMFETMLGTKCQPVVVGRTPIGEEGIPFLSWTAILSRLDASRSIPFVARLIQENVILPRGLVPEAEVPPDPAD